MAAAPPAFTPRPLRAEASIAVRFSGAAIQRGDRTILSGVELEVPAGEFVAVLGPNGAGKSTLLKAMLGVLPLHEGSVQVFGQQVQRGNDSIGYLPQRRNFDPDLRIRGRDLIRLGLDGSRWGIPLPLLDRLLPGARAARERVDEVVRLVGAEAYADRPIGELSGGEQQRLLIAQALVTGARLLLLDEPLESLDLHNQQSVSGLVQRVCEEQGVTVMMVAHDVNPILPYLDRVVYVAQGRIVAGRPGDVIRGDTLSRLYGTRVEVLRTSDGRIVVVGQHEPVSFHP
jgi:zinc/manganese transport system ATP-binding protein